MLQRTFRHLFWLLLMVSFLSACGGGDDGSPFASASGTDTTNTNGGTTGGDITAQSVNVTVAGNAVVPTGGITTIRIFTTDSSADPEVIVPFIGMNVTISGEAVINGSLKSYDFSTDTRGEAQFTVSHPGSGNVLLSVITTDDNVAGELVEILLYFGATANAIAQPDEVPANGTSAATLLVNVRDAFGVPIPNAFVDLSFPSNSFAVAAQASGRTGIQNTQGTEDTQSTQGLFSTTITNTVAQLTSVTPIVEQLVLPSVPIRFTTTTTAGLAEALDIIVRTDNVPANGSDAVSLIVVARDAAGTPVPNIPVNISSDSATALLSVGADTGSLFIKGNTGSDGSFELFVTNTVEEEVNITARTIVTSSTADASATVTLEDGQLINFQNPQVDTPDAAAVIQTLNIQEVIPNPSQPLANGIDSFTMVGQVVDSNSEPVEGVTVSIIANGGSASFPSSVVTNQGGFFRAVFTNTVAETITFFAVVGNIVSDLRSIAFAVVPPPGEAENPVEPGSITLIASPERQVLGQPITVTAIVRDGPNGTGAPMQNIDVRLSVSGATANSTIIDTGTTTTGGGAGGDSTGGNSTAANGTVTFTINNTVPGTFTVTAFAQAKNAAEELVGVVRTATTNLEFFQTTSNVADLNVTVSNNNQPANGTDAVTINVVAVDSGGRPVEGVPLLVQVASNNALQINPARDATDANGFSSIEITATEAERDIAVTIAVEGGTLTETETISFTALSGTDISPDSIELRIENNLQPADNSSRVTLIAIPRDQRGTPIAGIEVRLLSEATGAVIANPDGTTNELGEYRTTATSAIAETFNVTAVVAGAFASNLQNTQSVTFTPLAVSIPNTLTINVVGNNQEVSNENTTEIIVLALDENGTPMNNIPVVLSVLPGDVSNSVIFGINGFEGLTAVNGTFTTTVRNTQAGVFSLIATVRDTTQTSPPVEIVFRAPDTGAGTPEVSTIELITNNTQLASAGDATGVIITAIVKNIDNNLVSNVSVRFSATSGEILPIINEENGCTGTAGVTSEAGRACARLTTQGDSRNRTITVTAEVTSNSGDTRTDVIDIQVSGSGISIAGENTVILGGSVNLNISLRDSNNVGISNEALVVSSALGNGLSNANPITDSSGNASITVTANVGGQDTISVSKADGSATSATFGLTISEDSFTLVPNPDPNVTEVPLGDSQEFLVTWQKAGVPQVNQQINLSSTRGNIPATVLTDFNGQARFTVNANNAGVATITATAAAVGGPSQQVQVEFVATVPASITVQANPATLSINLVGSQDLQQSDITAVVRDAANNLVKGQRVTFNLDDITGGSISPASAVTDSFGRASTVYTSGASPSASGGVKITARVTDNPAINAEVTLTVARRAVFVSLGAGNTIEKIEGRRYASNLTVLVTDINGLPVPDATVDLDIYPVQYCKGEVSFPLPEGQSIEDIVLCNSPENFSICPNEDGNRNAILDTNPNEDINRNGVLDPGNVLTIGLQGNSQDQSVVTLTTDSNGFADFQVLYAIEYAQYITAEITATVTVEGSEAQDTLPFTTVCSAEDTTVSPPACPVFTSPLGVGSCTDAF